MSQRDQISNYLNSLDRYLAPLNKEDADEVIREIESHIFDVIDDAESKGKEPDIESILNRFGPPRLLAEKYVSHVRSGTPPPAGFKAIKAVKQGVTKTLFYGMHVFGYGIGIILIALAFANLLVPDGVGIWTEAGGNSVAIGFFSTPAFENPDTVLKGFWITPVAAIIGYLAIMLTFRVLQILKRNL